MFGENFDELGEMRENGYGPSMIGGTLLQVKGTRISSEFGRG